MFFDGALRRAAIRAIYSTLPLDQRYRDEVAREVNEFLENKEGFMTGWKSYLGSIIKGLAGSVATVIVGQIPAISDGLGQHGLKGGAIVAAVLGFLGNMLQGIGMAHKAERAIEATVDNTAAVEKAAISVQPVKMSPGVTVTETGSPTGPSYAKK